MGSTKQFCITCTCIGLLQLLAAEQQICRMLGAVDPCCCTVQLLIAEGCRCLLLGGTIADCLLLLLSKESREEVEESRLH